MARLKGRALLKRLNSTFRFEGRSGRLFWKIPPKYHPRLKGLEAGTKRSSQGKTYWIIKIDGVSYFRSRLVFLLSTGRDPRPQVDHRNGNSLDDRPKNLRESTQQQNTWNIRNRRKRSPLPMGVRIIPASGRFGARITINGEQIHLGAFDTPKEASAIYQKKRRELFGEFA